MKHITGYDNYTIDKDGVITNTRTGRNLTPCINKDNGYLQVDLWAKNKGTKFYVHRLIAQAFIDNPLNLPEVNHIDSVRTNNKLNNLEWVTSKKNSLHAVKAGRRDHVARMSKQDIEKAFDLVMKGNSYKEVSKIMSDSWQAGFLSVKVGRYADAIGKQTELKTELRRQRIVRSLKNLDAINK